jgi:hypothetical protein
MTFTIFYFQISEPVVSMIDLMLRGGGGVSKILQ